MAFNNAFAQLVIAAAEDEDVVIAPKGQQKSKNVGHGREQKTQKVIIKAKPANQLGASQMQEGGFDMNEQKQKDRGGFANKGRFGQSDAEDRKGGRGGRGRGGKGGATHHDRPAKEGEEREGGDRGRGQRRGGRGRGEDRGEGGEGRGRGERRERGDGERRGGGRGQNRPRAEGEDGSNLDRVEAGTGEMEKRRFQGKPRENYHPMDKHSGTGRGKRDQGKSGGGRGQWGNAKNDDKETEEVKEGETEKVENEEGESTEQVKVQEEKKVVEEEDEGPDVFINLDDYYKTKKTVATNEVRAHVKIDDKNTMENTEKKQYTQQYLKGGEANLSYAVKPGQGVELAGFQAFEDEEYAGGRGGRGDRRGGRGGRGGGNDRAPRQNTGRGQRKGGKIVKLTEDEFPTL